MPSGDMTLAEFLSLTAREQSRRAGPRNVRPRDPIPQWRQEMDTVPNRELPLAPQSWRLPPPSWGPSVMEAAGDVAGYVGAGARRLFDPSASYTPQSTQGPAMPPRDPVLGPPSPGPQPGRRTRFSDLTGATVNPRGFDTFAEYARAASGMPRLPPPQFERPMAPDKVGREGNAPLSASDTSTIANGQYLTFPPVPPVASSRIEVDDLDAAWAAAQVRARALRDRTLTGRPRNDRPRR